MAYKKRKFKTLSEEHKNNISIGLKKVQCSTRFNKGIIPWNKGLGMSSEDRKSRDSLEYAEWREKVFKRDNYGCLMPWCENDDTYVEAHHIKPFFKFKELRFILKNGITLCRDCHKHIKTKELVYERLFAKIV